MKQPAPIETLYAAHVAELSRRYAQAAERGGFDALVVGSGILQYRFLDDQAQRYVAVPHFLQWAPLEEHPHSALVLRAGERPVLVVHQPDDYWHQPPDLPPEFVACQFDLRVIGKPEDLREHLPAPGLRTALLGMPGQWGDLLPDAPRNPEAVVNYLHYHRARKTDWEIACLREATALAATGHRAAKAAFLGGAGEYDILNAFLTGCRQTENELPYGAIVALNEHGATLHYQHRDRDRRAPVDMHSLLIDAGCAVRGYASDITRSYSFRNDSFAAMIDDLDRLQQELCGAVAPGVSFVDLHRRTHLGIAGLLKRWQLVDMAPEAMVSAGVTFAFFPHGLGHLLGLQVHDVGGHMADDRGTPLSPPTDFPRLRFLRPLEPGLVVTVEPGVYFIDSLLAGLQAGPSARHIDWPRLAELRRFGGIRIEDDVLVTPEGAVNLTRPLLGN